MQWEPKPDSPSAIADDEYLASIAKDLAAYEPPPRAVAPIRSGITQRQLDKKIGDLLKRMGEIIGKELRTLRQRVAELEAGQLTMAGTWKPGERYRQNSLVSFQGGLWLCLADTDTRPAGSPAWRLAVKRGAAG
jgi:hypothetical protein